LLNTERSLYVALGVCTCVCDFVEHREKSLCSARCVYVCVYSVQWLL